MSLSSGNYRIRYRDGFGDFELERYIGAYMSFWPWQSIPPRWVSEGTFDTRFLAEAHYYHIRTQYLP